MTCTNCGEGLEPTATSCPACGAAVTGTNVSDASGAAGNDPDRPSPAPRPSDKDAPPAGSGYPPPSQPNRPNQPSDVSSETRNWALAAHLSAFLGAWIALAFVGPLVVWLLKREAHPFIDHHGREALNFNLSILLYGVALAVLAIPIGFLTLGLGFIPLILVGAVLVIAWLVLTVIAAISASNGELYRYPLTIRMVR